MTYSKNKIKKILQTIEMPFHLKLLLPVLLFSPTLFELSHAGVIEGKVFDSTSQKPVPSVSIRVAGTNHSILSNADGKYRLRLPDGDYQLKFSHVAYHTLTFDIFLHDSLVTQDVFLSPTVIPLEGAKVYSRAFDPAQEIIVEAIRRKEEILNQIHDYQFEAFTKLIVRDTTKPQPKDIYLITETQMEAFWEQPDKYKEIIIARRQTANVDAENNLVTIGEILNFNKNRIEIGTYNIVSPTAKDALDHYNYYLIDTVQLNDRPVFRLEVEPKNNYEPLFQGTIDIADSSYAVVGADFGFSKGFSAPFVENLHYSQRFDLLDNEYWMPVEIRFAADFKLGIPGLPVFDVDYVAALYHYKIEKGTPEKTFNEFVLEVDEKADKVDSSEWYSRQLIPLTDEELTGYHRIDSITHLPKPILKKLLMGTLKLTYLGLTRYDLFHFNRVEGSYLGFSWPRVFLNERFWINMQSGYAFDGKFWQHRYGFSSRLNKEWRLQFNASYHDQITRRSTIMSNINSNATLLAIANKTDPFDYFLERGFDLSVSAAPLKHFTLSVGYKDVNQYAAANHTEYSFFRDKKKNRINPAIIDGKLRSMTLALNFDSRPLMKIKKREYRETLPSFTSLAFALEQAKPGFVETDFDYRKLAVRISRSQRISDLGMSNLFLYLGQSSGQLPPQKHFLVEFNGDPFADATNFHTLGENLFDGDRVAVFYVEHDFDLSLFRKFRIPLLKVLPFSFSLHGGVFWTDYNNKQTLFAGMPYPIAAKPYSEFGFGMGRVPPIQLLLRFTWQLSNYNTNDFAFTVGTGFSF